MDISSPLGNNLQLVVSQDTDRLYHFRCLPGFFPKTYLNNHLFLGKDHPYVFDDTGRLLRVENEIMVQKNKFPLYKKQLSELLGGLEKEGYEGTFGFLSNHMKVIATTHQLLYTKKSRFLEPTYRYIFRDHVGEAYHELWHEVQKPEHTLSLIETIVAQTLILLGYTGQKDTTGRYN